MPWIHSVNIMRVNVHNHALYLLPVHVHALRLWTDPKTNPVSGSVCRDLPRVCTLAPAFDDSSRPYGIFKLLQRLWAELGGWGVQVTGMAYIQGPPWTQYASTGIYPLDFMVRLLCICLFSVDPRLEHWSLTDTDIRTGLVGRMVCLKSSRTWLHRTS